MKGKNYQIGKGCGPIWFKKSLGEILEMEHHPKHRMKIIFPWLGRGRREKEIRPKENLISANTMARIKT